MANKAVNKTPDKTKTSAKKKAPAAKAKAKKSAVKSDVKRPSKLRWCLMTAIKLFFVMVCAIAIYVIYLDGKVRNTFEGQRWQIPVQVFGQIEELSAGAPLNLSQLRQSLDYGGYRKVAHPKRPGEFAMSSQRIIIYRNGFDFGFGPEAPVELTINVENGVVSSVYKDSQQVDSIKLEPAFIDRILPQSKEDRILVGLENVPEQLIDTLLLVEDREFYFHHGVSPLGIARALMKNISAGRTVQGGSTLTQQLVKNMYLTRDKTITRKINEAFMALILEYRYSKDQLLEAYLNEVYLGQHYANGIYGFGLAAQFYFGEPIQALTPAQMALLIGQVKGPSYYDPWRFPDRAKKRRDLILRLMFEQNSLTKNQFVASIESDLSVRKSRRLVKQTYPAYMQKVKNELAEILTQDNQQTGIRVFTGFSLFSQLSAEKTVAEKLNQLEKSYHEENLQAAMVVTDIDTGEVRAMVGGRESSYAGFNRALHAQRPIGSLIKPAVFLAALERFEQYNFASVLKDEKITLTSDSGREWQPKNYDGKYRGQVNLLDALVYSLNIPTVNLGMSLGLENIAKAVHLLGYQSDIVTRPSLLLGSINMSPWQVNQLYLPVAAQGNYLQTHVINSVVSAEGEVLYAFNQHKEPRLSANGAYLIDHAMQQVTKTGTAKSLTWRLKDKNVAGKTGTTNEQRDSWFVGYDQQHLVTSWVGRDDNQSTRLTGSSGALVLFADFMNKQGVVDINSPMPSSIVLQKFEQESGHAVVEDCQNTVELPVVNWGLKIQPCLQKAPKEKSWFEKLFGD